MIRKLMQSIREYKLSSLLSPLFVVLEVVMEVVIPILMAKLIDDGIDGDGGMDAILHIGGILLVCCVASLLFGALAGHFAAHASAGFAKNLRHDMFYRVQTYSFSNIDKFSAASIVTRLTTDVTNVQNAYQMLVRIALRAPSMLIFAMVMAFRMSVRLSLIYLAAIPVLGIGLYFIMTRVHPIFERVFKTYDKLNNVTQENLHGIRVVKSFVREEYEKEKFSKISENIYQDFSKAEKRLAFNMPLMQFCMYACMILVCWFGARMIVSSTLTTGELMSLMTYATQILGSLMMLSMVFVMITLSRASAERIVEILDEESDITSPANAKTTVPSGSVDFDHVSFSYSKRKDKCCLTDIDLHIPAGMTVGILGGTGSAKSSLVQLIPRLYDATEGIVRVGGIDVREYDVEALREEVAMVLQKNVLFSGTIKENLRWGNPDATDEEMARVCRLAHADEFIRTFPDGYDTYIEQGGSNVSGGQKQRLCIARALLKKPKILILDDSTSAVDTHTDACIRQALRDEIPDTTKFIIAQRVTSLMDADLILVLDEGKIHGMGTHEELLRTDAIYQEIYTSQQKGSVPQ
ncbi:MAG: ABC transporter ATP-binding protein [Ruminococcus sp.]|uniref:ABC transporter ATP-binding protein n=1 Tax=Ruminococcus callidus TaxID=40519 RepID=UPI001D03282F|nr:ABC transporter ATP-binding protein [Ruminococcus callidus]MCB5774893.1 ABC transporter ATP-binding protein/permease [Ruminococcus callidus]MCC2758501.1 ABC transporter ATP-binding protein/permease [Ruminococcus callidus]